MTTPDEPGRYPSEGGSSAAQPGRDDVYGQSGQAGAYGQSPYGTNGPGYGQPKSKGLAIAAMVLGILGILGSWIPFLGLFAGVLGLIGLILGIVALRKVKKGTGDGKGMAITGIVLGALAVVVSIGVTVAAGALFGQAAEDCGNPPAQTDTVAMQTYNACLQDSLTN